MATPSATEPSADPNSESVESEAAIYARAKAAFERQEEVRERVMYVGQNVVLVLPTVVLEGTLTLTNHHLSFTSPDANDRFAGLLRKSKMALAMVERVERIAGVSALVFGDKEAIEIMCKDGRDYRFEFRDKSLNQVFEIIQKYSFRPQEFCYAFVYRREYTREGWEVYDAKREYGRMGLPNRHWRFSAANESYRLCDSYPAVLVVPQGVTDEQLKEVAAYRCSKRMPALCWLHPVNKAAITRSAQPLSGVTGKRSAADETLLRLIKETGEGPAFHILDSRPRMNAIGNTAMGKGFERAANYTDTDVVFQNIENIHEVRDAQVKLREGVDPSGGATGDTNFFQAVHQSKWLHHIKTVLSGALEAVSILQRGESVLVHCSDGWDRTSQISSLAQLMLDPYYRTTVGFAVLIEKDWLSFGHKFAQRCGHGSANHADDQRAPIFVQFLDCVWQLMRQHPRAFEFNETLLLECTEAAYSCRFGTFLYNSESQRVAANVAHRTHSFWSEVFAQGDRLLNPFYQPVGRDGPFEAGIILARPQLRHLAVWTGYYLRWHEEPHTDPCEAMCETMLDTRAELRHMRDELRRLRTRLGEPPLDESALSVEVDAQGATEERKFRARHRAPENGSPDDSHRSFTSAFDSTAAGITDRSIAGGDTGMSYMRPHAALSPVGAPESRAGSEAYFSPDAATALARSGALAESTPRMTWLGVPRDDSDAHAAIDASGGRTRDAGDGDGTRRVLEFDTVENGAARQRVEGHGTETVPRTETQPNGVASADSLVAGAPEDSRTPQQDVNTGKGAAVEWDNDTDWVK